jgi:hypothetical protein
MIGRSVLSIGVIAGGGLWWSGLVSSDSHTYALPANEVQARLGHSGLPQLVFGEEEPKFVLHSAPNKISWEVQKDGATVMTYVADLTPLDADHTKVRVAMIGVTEGKFGNVEARLRGDRTLKNLYLTAMKEQVDSVLANHPFRYSAISGATAAATAAHMHQIEGWLDRAAEAQHREERANMDKAYHDAGLD